MAFWLNRMPIELLKKICQLIEEPSLREQMGAAGYQKVVEQYTWEKLAEKTEQAYQKVLQG